MKNQLNRILILSSLLILTACGENKDDKAADGSAEDSLTTSNSGTSSGEGSEKLSEAKNVSDLKLVSAFTINLPDALDSNSDSLALLNNPKSQEACQMGQTIKEVTRSLEEVGNFFCHIEVEKDKIEFGVKTRITFEGQEFAKIWVDDSEEGRIRIGFCSNHEDGKNNQIINVTGLSDDGPIGSIINKGTHSETDGDGNTSTGSHHRSVDFNMSESGVVHVEASDTHSREDDSFNRKVALKLLDSGISEAILAAKGSWNNNEFAERGKALFDGNYGSAVFENMGVHEGNEFSFSRIAYFDKAGDVVESSASEEFASGGKLHLGADDLPEYLSADFAPSDLEGWVESGCEDFDKEVSINPESEAHQKCDGDRDEDYANCWDEGSYQAGSNL